jgi:lipopolysaccharide export system protein LptA
VCLAWVCLSSIATTGLHAAPAVREARDQDVVITADQAQRWQEGTTDVWYLVGNAVAGQGASDLRGRYAIVWIEPPRTATERDYQITVYAEGNVAQDGKLVSPREKIALAGLSEPVDPIATTDPTQESRLLVRYTTDRPPQVRVPRVVGGPKEIPAIYRRASAERFPNDGNAIRRTQFTSFDTMNQPAPTATIAPGTRRLRMFPRSGTPVRARWSPSGPNESVAVINSGVNIIIDGLTDIGSIDVAADRIVIWTSGMEDANLSGESLQNDAMPMEIYMEGNIVFRQGQRIVYAERMYYNVKTRSGTVLDAQLVTPVPEYAGLVRLRAEMIRQIDRDHFEATNAALTTSRLGIPSYWFQSKRLTFTDIQRPVVSGYSGAPVVDPETGEQVIEHKYMAGGYNNTVYVEGMPVLWWPTVETDLQRPTFYLNELKVKHDNVFGTQVYTNWDAYQVFGIRNPPEGTELDFDLDYLSERGPAVGARLGYERPGTFLPGVYQGFFDAWGIKDDGLDNLGRDRRELVPEEEYRGRIINRHRHRLTDSLTLSAELGWISDRNFLEQYFEREWDEEKDFASSIELKWLHENSSLSLSGNVRYNDFFTQTENVPKLEHFWLGQSLLFDRLTWYEHSHVGYAKMETATRPLDPVDAAKFDPLAWEVPSEGLRAATRQEIDAPFSLGPFRIVPYALGEAAYWGEDLSGEDVDRLYGQVGIRSSIPLWSVNPMVQSELFNLHGLAHKVTLDSDLFFAEANRDLNRFPLYDELDDDAVEHFRRRFMFDTFGGTFGDNVPLAFDERFYALRSGLGGWVSSPSTEVVDDLMAVKFGIRQRWQTKRGGPGNERIVDVVTLDTRAMYFPKPDRDNFGEELGLAEYDFRWHVGDRVTLVSEGVFDFFERGQRVVSAGGFLNRPPNGSIYLGVRSIEGPLSATVLNGSFTYKMSPKWIAAAGASVDLGDDGNIGQQFALTRIGESLLVRLGANVDASRGSFGASIMVEPRFWPKGKLSGTDGAQVLPIGPYDVE